MRDGELLERESQTSPSSGTQVPPLESPRIHRAPSRLTGVHNTGPIIRAPRGDLSTSMLSFSATRSVMQSSADPARCYFFISNTSTAKTIYIAFGQTADAVNAIGLPILPGAWYEAPIAPMNDFSVSGEPGATAVLVLGKDGSTV